MWKCHPTPRSAISGQAAQPVVRRNSVGHPGTKKHDGQTTATHSPEQALYEPENNKEYVTFRRWSEGRI